MLSYRIMGLDIGDATIGVSVCDLLGLTAQGITTIKRKSKDKDIEALNEIVKEYGVGLIVAGLPKNMNGTVGEQGEKVKKLCALIEERLGLKVELWDERLTTKAAHMVLIEGDVSRKKRKKVVDKLSAVFILQGYLDLNRDKL